MGEATETVEGVTTKGRNASGECVDSISDPRLSGTEAITFNYDVWTSQDGSSIGVQWGTGHLETADGAWEGTWAGVIYPGLRDDITAWYRGSGAYVGMTYTAHITGGLGKYQVEGLLYPGEMPPIR